MVEQELRDLICTRYKSVRAFAEIVNLPYTTVDSILKRGVERATVKSIIRLCQALDLDTDALADGRIEQRKVTLKVTISPEENEMIKKIRALDEKRLKVVQSVLDLASSQMSEFNNCILYKANTSFRVSDQSASAGTGTYLGPDGFHEILVEPSLVIGADFGVPVQGDSMEPKFHEGDIILVSMTQPVEVGDIALVTMDGCGYVKKIGHDELISLNPKYAPIPMTEDIRINGKVIGVLPETNQN